MSKKEDPIVRLPKPVLGLNNVSPDTDLPEGSLVSATNVDIDKEGNVFRRKGYTLLYSGSNIHSLYKKYFVEGTDLKQINDTPTPDIIATGLNLNNYLAWESVNEEDVYSDGRMIRRISSQPFSAPTPPSNPSLSPSTGSLFAGIYQVTVAFLQAGEIGGALLASSITVNDNAGITLSNIAQAPGCEIVVFCTTQNGEQLYHNITLSEGTTSFTIYNSRKHTYSVDTQFMDPLPPGHILRHFNARLYSAIDNVLWFSRPMRYGLCKYSEDFMQFAAKITIVQAVDDGLFVVADKTYFLAGDDPEDFTQVLVSPDTAIEGTGISVGGAVFGLDGDSKVAYWFSSKGAVLGSAGGQIKQLTEDRLAVDEGISRGATLFKEVDGIRQMVTSLQKGAQSSFQFGAQATTQIIRNGVIVT